MHTAARNRSKTRSLFRTFCHKIRQFLVKQDFKGSWRLRKLLEAMSMPPGKVVAPTIYGFDLALRPKHQRMEKLIYFHGDYEVGTLAMMSKLLRTNDTFLDIGANIGLMTVHAAKLVGPMGRVISFEPAPETYECLMENIELNDAGNVSAYQLGLGAVPGELTLHGVSNHAGRASLVSLEDGDFETTVNIDTLDRMVEKLDLQSIRMMKIDVEGFELEVLKGSTGLLGSPDPPILCMEYTTLIESADSTAVDRYSYVMNGNRYRCFKFKDHKNRQADHYLVEVYQESDLPEHDNIFFIPSNAIDSVPEGVIRPN